MMQEGTGRGTEERREKEIPVPGDSALMVRGLAKRYGTHQALLGLDLQVMRGDIYGFLGRNGAGKSTTIKILAGLVRPEEGSVRILGRSLHWGRDHAVRRRVGFLVESPAFLPHLNAVDNLLCHGLLQGRSPCECRGEALRLLESVGLSEAAERRVGEYSTGMLQRLGLAQAFLGEPELIVLDEPMSGLDPGGIQLVRERIREWCHDRGTTFVISSHILAEVERLCTRVGFIHRGRTVAEGTLEELGIAGWIAVRVAAPEQARRILQERWPEGVLDRETEEETLFLRLPEERVPEVVRLLVNEGVDVYFAGRRTRSLESVFMERTGGVE